MEYGRQRILRAPQALEQLANALQTEPVTVRRNQRQAFELGLHGRIGRPREIGHQAAAFFSGAR